MASLQSEPRHDSYTRRESTSTSTTEPPQTPPLNATFHRDLLDSPFSDYYTDSSRSSAHTTHSDIQKDLMRRINIISTLIQQSEPSSQSARAIHARLDAVEAALAAPDPQSRLHLEDSGLFLEDDDLKPNSDEDDAAHHRQSAKERELVAQHEQMSLQIADRFTSTFEEHLEHMNGVLDEAKQREGMLQELLDEAREREATMQVFVDSAQKSSRGLRVRLEETKQINNLSELYIDMLKRENVCLQAIQSKLRNRIQEFESELEELDAAAGSKSSLTLATLLQDPRSTRWKLSASAGGQILVVPDQDDESGNANDEIKKAVAEPTKDMSKVSGWKAFWDALGDAAGVVDYHDLMYEKEEA